MKIAVAGTGYVGLSIATLLAQHHDVTAVDIVAERVEKVNQRQSPIQDEYIERFFASRYNVASRDLDSSFRNRSRSTPPSTTNRGMPKPNMWSSRLLPTMTA